MNNKDKKAEIIEATLQAIAILLFVLIIGNVFENIV